MKDYKKGLKKGKVVFSMPENRTCIKLADAGFSISTIAQATGLTTGQVIYRCGKKNLKVSDYRNGKSPRATIILAKYKVYNDG